MMKMSSSSSSLLLHSVRRVLQHPSTTALHKKTFSSSQHTGRVVFYKRSKAYGFIKPNDNTKDVFVHRSGIQCLVPTELNPTNPYLKAGERVSYQLEGERAVNVKYENGREIPMYRDKDLETQIKAAHYELGLSIHMILANSNHSVERNADEIQQVYEQQKGRIEQVEKWMKQGKVEEERNEEEDSTEKEMKQGEAEEANNSDAASQEEDSEENVMDDQIEKPEQSIMEEQPEKL